MDNKDKKPKTKLRDITFDHEGAHLALVSKEINGGPANLQDYSLVFKGLNGFNDEIIEKASKVTVTLPIEDFLSKFFGLWCDDAEVLARVLGFTTEDMESQEEEDWYKTYIENKVASFQVMKSLHGTKVDKEAIGKLSGEQYLQLLKDQELLENSFTQVNIIKKALKASVKNKAKEDESNGSVNNKKETTMTKEVKTVLVDVEKELVEKSVLVDVEKQLKIQSEALEKANKLIADFEKEKKEAIDKARLAKLEVAIPNKEQAAIIFKGANLLGDTDFDALVSTIDCLVQGSNLTKEIGLSGEVSPAASVEVDMVKSVSASLAKKYSKK
jgi:hypothetical protein